MLDSRCGGIDDPLAGEKDSERKKANNKIVPLSPSPLPPHVLMTNQRN